MKARDTFSLASARIEGQHPHFVVCDPAEDGQVVVANLTAWSANKDQSCILEAGDERIVTKRSIVSYRDAKLVPNAFLDSRAASGEIIPRDPISQATLEKILLGFSTTRRTPLEVVERLESLGLLPLV